MTKTKRTITVIALFAATLLCALFATFAAAPAKTFADDEPASSEGTTTATEITGYNMYDIYQAKWPAGATNVAKYFDLSNTGIVNKADDPEYGNYILDVSCENDMGTNNLTFCNTYLYFEKDVAYTVSFKIRTLEGVEMSDTWKITTGFIVDGDSTSTAGVYSEGAVTEVKGEKIEEWREIKYTFTPSKTSSDGADLKNRFNIVFFSFQKGDCVQIKDIRVEYPKSALDAKGKNLYNGTIKPANPTQEDNITKTEVETEYGTATKFVCDVDLTTLKDKNGNAVNNAVFVRTGVAWKENVKYRVSFMYKTVKNTENTGSFANGYAHIRAKGKANTDLGGFCYANGTAASMSVDGGQWKMFNYEFSLSDLKDDASRTENVFEFCLNPFQKGDEFWIAAISITEQCVEHNYAEVTSDSYVWAADNSTCTATRACTECGYEDKEIVTAVETDSATCTAGGKITYTATFENTAFETQTKDGADTEAKGHTYGEVTYTWNDDNTKCTAVRTCTVDGCSDKEEETVDAVASEDTATCTEAGKITYTATFTNSAFAAQTKDVATPAKGHDYKDGKCSVCEAADPDYKAPDAGTDNTGSDNTGSDNTGSDNTGKTDDEGRSGCGSSISAITFLPALVIVLLAAIVIVKNARKKD